MPQVNFSLKALTKTDRAIGERSDVEEAWRATIHQIYFAQVTFFIEKGFDGLIYELVIEKGNQSILCERFELEAELDTDEAEVELFFYAHRFISQQ